MTEQKTLTFMEAIAEARKGAKLRNIYSCAMVEWMSGELVDYAQKMPIPINEHTVTSRYIIVTPAPKPKVKVALYAYRVIDGWKLSDAYYIDDADFMKNSGLSTKDFKRLDWSEMEVEE